MAFSRMQLTLAILKPDIMIYPVQTKVIKEIIINNEFVIVQSRVLKWTQRDAEEFYAEHKGRFFYNRLVGFMSSVFSSRYNISGPGYSSRFVRLLSCDHVFCSYPEYDVSGAMNPMILGRENAIAHWRQLMGPTHAYRAREVAPESIRALYGISDTRNATHGSDSEESAEKEIKFFFPKFDYHNWLNSQSQ